jgi:hypothetical protein
MTTIERVQAVADYGFTERQARFLVLVMRHAGLCIKRQYATFAGIANGGEKCNAFFDKLVRRGFAVAVDCIHNRARLYHVHSKLLYHAIGEPDSRYRRTVPARAAAERLMRLDAALTSPDCEWLTSRSEKLAYRQLRTVSESSRHAAAEIQDGPNIANQLPGRFPIGVDSSGHVLLLYLATVPWIEEFRTFLVGHTSLLAVTRDWTLRVVFPQPLRRVLVAYQTAVDEELKNPLKAENISDLKRYFFHRRRGTDLAAIPEGLRVFLRRCADVYGSPRFAHLYRRWLAEQDAAFTPVSPIIQDAIATGRGRVEYVLLPYSYEHLSPLVTCRRVRRRRRRKGDEGGDETPRRVNPSVNPAPQPGRTSMINSLRTGSFPKTTA